MRAASVDDATKTYPTLSQVFEMRIETRKEKGAFKKAIWASAYGRLVAMEGPGHHLPFNDFFIGDDGLPTFRSGLARKSKHSE